MNIHQQDHEAWLSKAGNAAFVFVLLWLPWMAAVGLTDILIVPHTPNTSPSPAEAVGVGIVGYLPLAAAFVLSLKSVFGSRNGFGVFSLLASGTILGAIGIEALLGLRLLH
jgi:hypothetical protein